MRRTYLVVTFAITFLLLSSAVLLPAQQADAHRESAIPTITFDLFWEAATPQNFTITVDSAGKATYVSRNPTRHEEGTEESNGPDEVVEFTMSDGNRDRLFGAAKKLNFFQGDYDYKQHRIANTGRKTLSYADSGRHYQTVYNWSENKEIEQLTRLFQGVSKTIEHGRKLLFLKRFDKLGLDKELHAMEDEAQNQGLAELQIIATTLQNIENDAAVLNMARQRAHNLLARAGISKD
jgi:hypothetical protein